ncbi:hypothetical protein RA2_04337 [Roseovarius sp. A-2]|uniref:hypothetical protein n=1 Tax=Roseovarius sp. A-2 TaxID=1570360 RepID=UPI0009B56D7F|nr:hypothetical protein [Roseovarius sp. A-2]GAW37260.1 hypothetical protein RA2_04337 [Roseovarius sp. A-2]
MDRPARTFVLPVPLSRMLAAYTLIQESEPNIGTEILIPVTNLVDGMNGLVGAVLISGAAGLAGLAHVVITRLALTRRRTIAAAGRKTARDNPSGARATPASQEDGWRIEIQDST